MNYDPRTLLNLRELADKMLAAATEHRGFWQANVVVSMHPNDMATTAGIIYDFVARES